MNCSDFELLIASESDNPAAAQHVAACRSCREFARELAQNAVALRAMDLDPAAYTAVRKRVMEAVRPRPRFAWLWAAAGVLAASCAALLWLTAPLRAPAPPPPQAVTFTIAPPELRAPPIHESVKRRVRRRSEPRQQLEAIKLLTDDPNVVIIWLLDNKKGDSL